MQCTETVSLRLLRNKMYASVLCYPRYSTNETAKRIKELKRLGVSAIEFGGEKTAFDLPVLGKGCVGIVVAVHTPNGRAALKIRRVDADRGEMEHEAQMLSKANTFGVGPRLFSSSRNFLLMEFVDGIQLPAWVLAVKGRGSGKRIRGVLRQILQQCRKMDKAGLDHGELNRAPKHVIVDSQDQARIVDFETASVSRKTSNVTSICQYLFIGSQLAKIVRRRLDMVDRKSLIVVLRNYKWQPNEENFQNVLEICRLIE